MTDTKTDKLEVKPDKLIRCGHCNGRKKVMGMGGWQVDCPTCKGVGHILIDVTDDKKGKK